MNKQPPTREVAQAYVHNAIFEVGGWKEALHGLRHKTLPFLLGLETSLTFGRIVALLFRLIILVLIALFPIFVRKAIVAPPPLLGPPVPNTLSEGFETLKHMMLDLTAIDYVMGTIAILLTLVPKILDAGARQKQVAPHSPYYDLTDAMRKMPPAAPHSEAEADPALERVLRALRDEMSQLIGDEARVRVTDVTFLEFADPAGLSMQVRLRTANHEDVKRPVPSERFMAYYVALEGRSFAEHDFLRKANPFPAKRITVLGSPNVDYRSVLYIPVTCPETMTVNVEHGPPAPKVVDWCIGVICIHSAKPYRFWRWGDHKKGTGGFADVATHRAMPYIALIKRLTEQTARRIKVEAA